jgi:hypothetical protein
MTCMVNFLPDMQGNQWLRLSIVDAAQGQTRYEKENSTAVGIDKYDLAAINEIYRKDQIRILRACDDFRSVFRWT